MRDDRVTFEIMDFEAPVVRSHRGDYAVETR